MTCDHRPLLPSSWLLSAALLGPISTAIAEEAETRLDTITVTGQSLQAFNGIALSENEAQAATLYEVTPEGMSLFGAQGGKNPYTMISGLPAVEAQSVDALGYANVEGGQKGLRVRGEVTAHGANGTVEGLPLTGVSPGPGYLWLFDKENMASVTLIQGPVPPDNFELFSAFGALDTRIRWPEAETGGEISLSAGSNAFRRGFIRADSGLFGSGTRFFVSGSSASADKWRGAGKTPDQDHNLSLGVSQEIGNLTLRLYAAHNDMSQYSYRPLDYTQASDLDNFRSYDYSTDPADRANDYKHNRQAFDSDVVLAEFDLRLNDHTTLSIKPFHSREEGYYLSAISNTLVRKWLIDHEREGITAEIQTKIGDTDLKAGYLHYKLEPPGPPTAWKLYNADASGNLSFSNWMLLAKVTEKHAFNSVYAKASHEFGPLSLEGGTRYVRETLPSIEAYDTSGVGDFTYEEALAASSGVVDNRSAVGGDRELWLPYLSASLRLNDQARLKLAAGRTMGSPAISVWQQYQSKFSAFNAAGVTAQDVVDKIRPSTSDGLDLGLRLTFDQGYLEPTLYYAKFHHKAVSFYDPVVNLAYPQNVGEGHQAGAQLAAGWHFDDHWNLFSALSYTQAVFDKEILTAGGATLDVVGKQLPDVPEWMANLGLKWQSGDYQVSPVIRYVGSRYADSAHTEQVSAYTTLDLHAGYEHKLSQGSIGVKLGVTNLLDEGYIGQIKASDVQSSGAYNYFPGAPRTFVASLNFRF